MSNDTQSNIETVETLDRLNFLARLPLLLNSSLESQRIIETALNQLSFRLNAEAATIFILNNDQKTLTFWALKGSNEDKLEGLTIPANKGIVGWVITHQQSLNIENVNEDKRFFSDVDKHVGFQTKSLLCIPLNTRGNRKLGAIQILNKRNGVFSDEDLIFLEQFGHQIALAIDNAQLYQDLQDRRAKLEILDQRKNEMISVIAHEFRTPLNLICTSVELLSSGVLPDKNSVDKMTNILNTGVKRLTKLISEIRNLSYVSGEKIQLKLEKFEVKEFLENCLEVFKSPAFDRKISLNIVSNMEAVVAKGDLGLLTIVVNNLIANAIRFTPDGGKIELSFEKLPGGINITISDNGIGIAPEQQKLIFDKFYEVGSALQHSSGEFEYKSGGLGVGLACVKAILDSHGAPIKVESSVGTGSKFSFFLSE